MLLWDERWSTQAVTRTLIEQDASRAKRADLVDKMAAAYILQGAIDSLVAVDPGSVHLPSHRMTGGGLTTV